MPSIGAEILLGNVEIPSNSFAWECLMEMKSGDLVSSPTLHWNYGSKVV